MVCRRAKCKHHLLLNRYEKSVFADNWVNGVIIQFYFERKCSESRICHNAAITWQPLRVDIDEPNDQLPKSEVLSVTT